jgi:uncharacterized protein
LVESFPGAERIDLLRAATLLRYQLRPDAFREEVLARPKGSWILVDEIQKLPSLLDEIHAIIFDTKKSYSFAITGSSARRLKREHANLLAGRALNKKFFPLLTEELGSEFDLETQLSYGSLPGVINAKGHADRFEFLNAYVDTYLKEEIQQEAVVRNLLGFTRFIKVAAICNGEVLNISSIARDVGVARSTVQGYFEIFLDTLLGSYLPALQLKAKVKEVSHPKFYWFDTGVLRVLRGNLHHPPEQAERGHLFETFLLNELKALDAYTGKAGEFSYWRTESGNEVDCIWTQGKRRLGFEFKIASAWKSNYQSGLSVLLDEGKIKSGYGVYTGSKPMKAGNIWIFPYREFLARFYRDEL